MIHHCAAVRSREGADAQDEPTEVASGARSGPGEPSGPEATADSPREAAYCSPAPVTSDAGEGTQFDEFGGDACACRPSAPTPDAAPGRCRYAGCE